MRLDHERARACTHTHTHRDGAEAAVGPDHCDRARVASDVSSCLEFLMAHAPEALYAAFPGRLDTWQKVHTHSHSLPRCPHSTNSTQHTLPITLGCAHA